MSNVKGPRLPKLMPPSLTEEQVLLLIDKAGDLRKKAIIAVAVESGLRVSELAAIRASDIDWQASRKEALAPFGELSEAYLKQWIAEYQPNGSSVWELNSRGIQMMLKRLRQTTGLPCNPHTFRRTFAVLLRKAGVDTMTIRDLGRWESVQIVERYTRSFGFSDAMKFYKAPLR